MGYKINDVNYMYRIDKKIICISALQNKINTKAGKYKTGKISLQPHTLIISCMHFVTQIYSFLEQD